MVSVVIPAYNRATTIRDAVESVLNQTFQEIEVIVVDDCSTDITREIVEGIKDNRLRYIRHGKNKGACAARNTGIKNARGEFVAFHDSDDIWHADKLKKQLRIFKKFPDVDVVFCALNRYNYGGNDGEKFPNMEEGIKTHRDIVMGFCVSTQTIIGKRFVFEENCFDESMPRMQDYDLMVRVSENHTVYYLDEALVDVYWQDDSISSKNNWFAKTEAISKKLLQKYPNFAKKYPEWKVEMLSRIGHCQLVQGEEYKGTYLEIFKMKKSIKNLLLVFLANIGVLKVFFKKLKPHN